MKCTSAATVLLILFSFASVLTGCSSAAKRPGEERAAAAPTPSNESRVEIVYLLGHDRHGLIAELKDGVASAQAFLDREVLKRENIDPECYARYLRKVSEFLAQPDSASSRGCRTPYTVTLRDAQGERKGSGCRDAGEAAFGRLVREGEFLLHSRK